MRLRTCRSHYVCGDALTEGWRRPDSAHWRMESADSAYPTTDARRRRRFWRQRVAERSDLLFTTGGSGSGPAKGLNSPDGRLPTAPAAHSRFLLFGVLTTAQPRKLTQRIQCRRTAPDPELLAGFTKAAIRRNKWTSESSHRPQGDPGA